MTQAQKISGGIGILFLIIALLISMAPDRFLYRNAGGTADSYTSYAGEMASAPSESVKGYDIVARSQPESAADASRVPSPGVAPTAFGEKIIKNGNLVMQVASIGDATASIRTIAKTNGGDIVSEAFSQYSPSVPGSQHIVLKVASQNFDAAMEACKAIAEEVSYQAVSTEDVTSQYVDLEARLKNAYAEEASYVAVLARATTVEDILKVQDYLSRVRSDIESMEAQKQYLDGQTSFSTIEVTLTEDERVTLSDDSFRPWQAVVDAAQTVVEGFQAFVIGLIQFIIVGGAVLIPLVLVAWIGRTIWRRVRK